MDRIIRTCKASLLLAAYMAATPVHATSEAEDLRAMADYAAARMADIEDRQDSAIAGYLKLHRIAPQSAVLTDRLLDVAIRKGDMATAVRAARAQELQNASSDTAPLLFFADAFRAKKWAMARLAAKELAQAGRFSFMAPMLEAWVDVATGKPYELKAEEGERAGFFAYYSHDQEVYLDLAAGRTKEARARMQQLAEEDFGYVRDLLIRAAPVIAASGDVEFAEAMQQAGLGADNMPSTAAPYAQKSRAKMTPADGLAALHVRVATSLLDQNVTDDGLLLARIAVWLSPNFEPGVLTLSRSLDAQQLPDEAIKLRGRIAPNSPYWSKAVGQQVDALSEGGRERDALAAAEKASSQYPESSRFLMLTGRSQVSLGDFKAAADTYSKLVNLAEASGYSNMQRATYRLLLASALSEAGQWPQAREHLDKALILDPNNTQVLNYLGYSLLEKNQEIPLATSMIERAYKREPDSPAITDSLGWARYLSGDYTAAVALIEQAAQKSGNDSTINEHLGDAYWRAGRKVDARYAWRAASQTAEDQSALRLASKLDIGLPDSPK